MSKVFKDEDGDTLLIDAELGQVWIDSAWSDAPVQGVALRFTAAEAREVARAILAAADELEVQP